MRAVAVISLEDVPERVCLVVEAFDGWYVLNRETKEGIFCPEGGDALQLAVDTVGPVVEVQDISATQPNDPSLYQGCYE